MLTVEDLNEKYPKSYISIFLIVKMYPKEMLTEISDKDIHDKIIEYFNQTKKLSEWCLIFGHFVFELLYHDGYTSIDIELTLVFGGDFSRYSLMRYNYFLLLYKEMNMVIHPYDSFDEFKEWLETTRKFRENNNKKEAEGKKKEFDEIKTKLDFCLKFNRMYPIENQINDLKLVSIEERDICSDEYKFVFSNYGVKKQFIVTSHVSDFPDYRYFKIFYYNDKKFQYTCFSNYYKFSTPAEQFDIIDKYLEALPKA